MILRRIRDLLAAGSVAAAVLFVTGCNRPLEVGEQDGGQGGGAAGGNGGGGAPTGGSAGGGAPTPAPPPPPPCPPGQTCPPEQYSVHYFEQNVNNDIDILFMVDNNTSMENKQANLERNFPTFIDVLKTLPAGLPNVHIGVVSSSLGAGAFTDVPGCPANGDRGAFQNAPRGGSRCTYPTDPYIISLQRGTKNNFDGDISDAFKCIAELGTGGCGVQHQLAASARALGGNLGGWKNGAPDENSGFLRPDAFLAVILITDEDDCSLPIDSDLFDTKQNSVSDPYGPLASYRCTEFGILCGGARPPRTPVSNLSDCHDAGPMGKLIPVTDFVEFFKGVKYIPGRILVSAIAGPPAPFSVATNGNGWPVLLPSCVGGGTNGNADPGVRIREFVDAFGQNGTFTSICADSYAPAMNRIAQEIGKRLGSQCIDGVLKDTDPDSDGTQPDCTVVDQTLQVMGTVSIPLPNCSVGGPPCWSLVSNNRDCTASGFELKIDRGSKMAPPNTITAVSCATCSYPENAGTDGCP